MSNWLENLDRQFGDAMESRDFSKAAAINHIRFDVFSQWYADAIERARTFVDSLVETGVDRTKASESVNALAYGYKVLLDNYCAVGRALAEIRDLGDGDIYRNDKGGSK